MVWEEGVFELSLCQKHGRQYEQKEIIDYSGLEGEAEGRRRDGSGYDLGPYG
jgi:hypothetical protein